VWVDRTNINWGGCYLGLLVENRQLLNGKVQKLYPHGDFGVSKMEKIKLDQDAHESELSKINQKPTLGESWLRSSTNNSVLES